MSSTMATHIDDVTDAQLEAMLDADILAGRYADIGIFPPADTTAEPYAVHTIDALRALPPVEYLVRPYLVRGVNFTVAQPGGFKTFTALAWSFDAPGPVLYVSREGLPGIPLRLDAHAAAHGKPLPVMRFLTDADLTMPDQADRVIATGEGMRRDGPGAPVLIVIDTLNDTTGVDENGPEMKAAYQAVRRIQAHFQNAVLACVHTGWNTTRERGHSSIRGVSDNTMLLERNDANAVARLTCLKVRDGAPFEPEYLRLEIPDAGTPWLVPSTEAAWKETGRDKLRDRAERLRLTFGEREFEAEEACDVFNVATPATARKYLNELAEKYLVKRIRAEREPGVRGSVPVRWQVAPPVAPEWTPVGM